jgi:hypothetical protein
MAMLNSYSRIPFFQLMHCLKSVRAIISAVLWLDEHLSQTNTSVSRNIVTSRCTAVLFGTPLSGYALLNASQTAANDFDAKLCSRMNTRSACEYTMLASAQLLRSWCEQRPSNKGDLDSSVAGEVGRVCYTGVDLRLI